MRTRVSLALALGALIGAMWGAAGAGSAASGHRRLAPDLFARLEQLASKRVGQLGRGAWCWFGDPRAVHVGGPYGQTFVGWIGWNGAITIASYDPVVGVTRMHAVGRWFHDDHASPSILLEPDQRLTVFWSFHNGATMNYRTTVRPLDIGAWGPIRHVRSRLPGNLGFTYPNPVLVPAEGDKLYLFWRGQDWGTDYATRTPSGRWSAAHELISQPGQRPYVKVAGDGSDQIAMAFDDAHPGDTSTSVYYVVYRRGSLWTAGGRWIARLGGAPIAPRRAQLVYDGRATGVPSWVWDVAFDRVHHPVIVYTTFRSLGNHAYWYARWNGRRWVSHFLTYAGPSISPGTIEDFYSGGLVLDHGDPSVVYLSRKTSGWFEIERWTTPDGGVTWSHATVARSRTSDDVRPVVARGADGGPMSLLWLSGHYGSYVGYRTSIAFLRW